MLEKELRDILIQHDLTAPNNHVKLFIKDDENGVLSGTLWTTETAGMPIKGMPNSFTFTDENKEYLLSTTEHEIRRLPRTSGPIEFYFKTPTGAKRVELYKR